MISICRGVLQYAPTTQRSLSLFTCPRTEKFTFCRRLFLLHKMTAKKKFPDLSGLKILIMDDDQAIIKSFRRGLKALGADVEGASSVYEARLLLENQIFDCLLADLKLRDGDGLSLLPLFHRLRPDGLFYLITGHGTIDNAISAIKQGVRDYLLKPVDLMKLASRLEQDFSQRKPALTLKNKLSPYLNFQDPATLNALTDLPRYAALDDPVLINGETGTGKELVARAVHQLSTRKNEPFIALNCGAIPETMLESELFGYEKGAFTGATTTHKGKFEQASGGTLFLDEIGEMPISFQTRLLRVLETSSITRLGGEHEISVDVRIVAATNRNLKEAVHAGLFREDLFYRLDVLPVTLPPLRKRPRDIIYLARLFLSHSLNKMGQDRSVPLFSPGAIQVLLQYHWPGNIRELKNIMVRLAIKLPPEMKEIGPEFLKTLLPEQTTGIAQGIFIPEHFTLSEAEHLLIEAALKRTNFNRKLAARQLGISERTLRRKLKRK